MTVKSFPPIETNECRILVLGSMPGADSLKHYQYYAHKQNAFWFIMGECFGAGFNVEYDDRLKILSRNKIALWDVLKQCQREGSLDSKIHDEQPNDIELFVERHKNLERILFNGKKSEQMFKKYITLSKINNKEIEYIGLPSTSPAMAMLNKQQKCKLWRQALFV